MHDHRMMMSCPPVEHNGDDIMHGEGYIRSLGDLQVANKEHYIWKVNCSPQIRVSQAPPEPPQGGF